MFFLFYQKIELSCLYKEFLKDSFSLHLSIKEKNCVKTVIDIIT